MVSRLPPMWVAVAAWGIPLLAFAAALVVALRATAGFTRLLEALGDHWQVSAGLLGFVSAIGANMPNYVAALTASAGRQPLVGQQIIIGSNVYNLAIILGIAVFAVPGARGIVLRKADAEDVVTVLHLALAMAATTMLTFLLLESTQTLAPAAVGVVVILLTLGLFLRLAMHAFQRVPAVHDRPKETRVTRIRSPARAAVLALVALAVAMGSVVIMVQAGQRFGAAAHLPSALLSLVVLAVATSLPNTVVGYQLARAARVTASLEELLSSNCVNLALGSALPLLIWRPRLHDPWLLVLDTPLMLVLTLALLLAVRAGRIPRVMGVGLMGVYLAWVGIHMAL